MRAGDVSRFGICNCKRFAMQFASRPWIGFKTLGFYFTSASRVTPSRPDGDYSISWSTEQDSYSVETYSGPVPVNEGPFPVTDLPTATGRYIWQSGLIISFEPGESMSFEFRRSRSTGGAADTTHFYDNELSVSRMEQILLSDLARTPLVYDSALVVPSRFGVIFSGDGQVIGGARELFDGNPYPNIAGIFTGSSAEGFIERGYAQRNIRRTLPVASLIRLKSFVPGRHGLRTNALEQFDGKPLSITDTFPCETIEGDACDQILGKVIEPPEDNYDGSLVNVLFENRPCS